MSAVPLDFSTANALWGGVLAETLARLGVAQAVVSPGSRSTPLTLAFARHAALETIPVLDERSAAFFALGLARKSGRPVVLVCTSGTAGANYLPAVIEARESGVPLIVITADRPPEMRACASGQTIDQQKLFGAHVNFYHELAVPVASREMLAYLRQTIVHAGMRSLRPQRGPVQLNAPFRDPLVPHRAGAAEVPTSVLEAGFFDQIAPLQAAEAAPVPLWAGMPSGAGVIVAGPEIVGDGVAYAQAVGALAVRLGWPVLADGASPLRHFPADDAVVIGAYDAILRHARTALDLRPQHVLCLGNWPTSKVLRQWLDAADAEVVLLSERLDNRDSLHGRTRQLQGSVFSVRMPPAGQKGGGHAAEWRQVEAKVLAAMAAVQRPAAGIFEGDVVPLLAEALPGGTPVFVASSMPIRDAEYFWPVNGRGLRLFFNRGANGIDGTLSSALGIAHGGPPAVLLTGDLAFLHDSNGLLLRKDLRGSLTVVLINNAGGGIFGHLPIAAFDPPFERYFATPQQVDFALLSQAHGAEHILVRDGAHLAKLCRTLPAAGIRILEVKTDRRSDVVLRKQLFAAAVAALG
jgi:2-succinyl-5-enolpyruvyl-6-hydroxy-3-cyclohexene-1-carboxylate synthase